MDLNQLSTVAQVEAFLDGTQPVAFTLKDGREERYQCVEQVLAPVSLS